jgi:hypothetical protein
VHVGFDHTDVERHPVIPHVLAMYQWTSETVKWIMEENQNKHV